MPTDPPRVGAGRFAPTPTGRLHLGNARTALLAWLSARSQGLRTILRVEDLDPQAIPKGCLEGQYADLDWLGLRFDEDPRCGGDYGPYRQSQRNESYQEILNHLNDLGLLYPCWCSRKEVRMAALAPHASDEGPVYAGTCRPHHGAERIRHLKRLPDRKGRQPALRLDVSKALLRLGVSTIDFDDCVAGRQSFSLAESMGDFVVQRVDGIAAYQIACSYDDVVMGCVEVIRGCDLLPSAARQILILRSLGLAEPVYGHVGLVMNHDGERLAKRDDAIALTELRSAGIPAGDVISLLASLSGLPPSDDLKVLTRAFRASNLTAESVYLPRDWRGLKL